MVTSDETSVLALLVHIDDGSKFLPHLILALSFGSQLVVVDVHEEHGSFLWMPVEAFPLFGNSHESEARDLSFTKCLPPGPCVGVAV